MPPFAGPMAGAVENTAAPKLDPPLKIFLGIRPEGLGALVFRLSNIEARWIPLIN